MAKPNRLFIASATINPRNYEDGTALSIAIASGMQSVMDAVQKDMEETSFQPVPEEQAVFTISFEAKGKQVKA